jgi:hypothetical protein
MHVCHYSKCTCHLWPVWLYHNFPHYLINGTIFGKKVIEHNMCFDFFYNDCVCLFVSLLHQGPEPRPLVALQPLGSLYALFSRSSHCRRQMSPCPTRRERSRRREGDLQWAIKSSREFCLNADFQVTFWDLLHAVNLRHGTAGFTSPPKEGVLWIFSPWKIRRLRPGLNPRTLVLEANTHPLDHRSRLTTVWNIYHSKKY